MQVDRVVAVGSGGLHGAAGDSDEESFPEELVEWLLSEFTRPDDLVLDPFAGFGTTLVVAERMGRRGLGVELLPERVTRIRRRLREPRSVLEHDARDLAALDLPAVDCSLSSPPYMTRADHPQNPLTGYQTLDADYDRYLDELRTVYTTVADRLRPGGHVIVNAAHLTTGKDETNLAQDLVSTLAPALQLTETIEVRQLTQPSWLIADYCLVFRPNRRA